MNANLEEHEDTTGEPDEIIHVNEVREPQKKNLLYQEVEPIHESQGGAHQD